MQGHTIRLLSEYIADLHRRDRERDRNSSQPTVYQTAEFDTNGVERDWSGDERSDSNSSGQSGDNIQG